MSLPSDHKDITEPFADRTTPKDLLILVIFNYCKGEARWKQHCSLIIFEPGLGDIYLWNYVSERYFKLEFELYVDLN